LHVPFRFERSGSRVIFYEGAEVPSLSRAPAKTVKAGVEANIMAGERA